MTLYVVGKANAITQYRKGTGLTAVYSTFVTPALLALSDVIQFVKVPRGAVILDTVLSCERLDTGGTLTLEIGDGDTRDRYILNTNIGQSGGVVRLNNRMGNGYVNANDDTVDVYVRTAASGLGAGGALTLSVTYLIQ